MSNITKIDWPRACWRAAGGLLLCGGLSAVFSPISPLLALSWSTYTLAKTESKPVMITTLIGLGLTVLGLWATQYWFHYASLIDHSHFPVDAEKWSRQGQWTWPVCVVSSAMGGALIAAVGYPKSKNGSEIQPL